MVLTRNFMVNGSTVKGTNRVIFSDTWYIFVKEIVKCILAHVSSWLESKVVPELGYTPQNASGESLSQQ